MSQPQQKITPKNLSYNTELPPFLARLRGQQKQDSREGGGRDPLLAAHRRPAGKGRSASEEAEDAPLVVDERGNAVPLDGQGNPEGGEGEGAENDGAGATTTTTQQQQQQQQQNRSGAAEKVAGIGAGRKRKAGRVVGGGGGGGDDGGEDKVDGRGTARDEKPADKASGGGDDDKLKKNAGKKTKKAKKIKLSFGDDEDEDGAT